MAFIQFIKSLLGLYIQKTVIFESTKLIISEMFHFSMGFTIFFSQSLRTFKLIINKWLIKTVDNLTDISNNIKTHTII